MVIIHAVIGLKAVRLAKPDSLNKLSTPFITIFFFVIDKEKKE